MIQDSKRISLQQLIDNIVAEKRLEYSHRSNVNLFVRTDSDSAQQSLIEDQTMLSRILSNLVNNSYEAIPDGQAGRIEIECSSADGDDQPVLLIAISDNGVGFSQLALNNIEIGNQFTSKPSGQGLGLRVAREFLMTKNGQLRITNREAAVRGWS